MKQEDPSPWPHSDEPDWQLLAEKLADIEARLAKMPEVPPSEGLSDEKLATIATSIYGSRRRRLRYFDEALFGEPAWDMLLDLFVNKALGRRISTTSLCLAANVPQATGLRYISLLEQKGFIRRLPAPEDGRVTVIDLTTLGYKQMRRHIVDGMGRFDLPRAD